jgi:hypothetical protein
MASSTTPLATDAGPAAGELVTLRKFPQLERLNALPSDRARELYARGMNNPRSFWILNRRYVAALDTRPAPELTPAARRVADDLAANGIAFADFTEFFDTSFLATVSEAFYRYLEEFQRTASPKAAKGKGVFLDTVHKAHTFVPNDPVSAYLGEPMFAAIAASYMGMVPRFVGSSFWRTRAATGHDRIYSQAWHRDYNDRMLVKAFLYVTDVGAQEGYFEYVAGSHERGLLGPEFDRIGPDGFRAYPDAASVEQRVGALPAFDLDRVPAGERTGSAAPWNGKPAVLRCLAPRGTLIFADSFGLHRGGFVESGHRDMIMTTYSTNFNVHKPHFAVTRGFADTLSPFMRTSFGID